MFGLPSAAALDGLIQLGAFLFTCVMLHLLLRVTAREPIAVRPWRLIVVVGSMVVVRLYMYDAGWAWKGVLVVALLFALAFLMLLQFMGAGMLDGAVLATVLVLMLLYVEQSAQSLSDTWLPSGPSLAEYMGFLPETMDEPEDVAMPPPKPIAVLSTVATNRVAVDWPIPLETNLAVEVAVDEPILPLKETNAVVEVAVVEEPVVPVPETNVVVAIAVVEEPETSVVETNSVEAAMVVELPVEEITEEVAVAVEVPQQAAPVVEEPQADPFVRVTTHLGVMLVPADEAVKHEWIRAAHSLQLKGYVSLGDEVVILCEDGTMLHKGEDWMFDFAGFTYSFSIDTIKKNKVTMRANGRMSIDPESGR